MSTFSCPVVKIEKVERHPNADTLILCTILGYNCISSDIAPDQPRYKEGDYVVYIPEGAIVPDWLLQKMEFWKDNKGTLAGSSGNRVKTIRLRNVYSQGIMYPVNPDMTLTGRVEDNNLMVSEGDDVSDFLGIIKYEPIIPVSMRGQVGAFHGYTRKYDIENIKNFPGAFLPGDEVRVTEKLHGTNCQISFMRNVDPTKHSELFHVQDDWYAFATSKGLGASGFIQKAVDANKENLYVKTCKTLIESGVAAQIINGINDNDIGFDQIFIFGEIFGPGVQAKFGYSKTKPEFKVFDIYLSGHGYLNHAELNSFTEFVGLQQVPTLYVGQYDKAIIDALVDGDTVEGNGQHIREGVVIRTTTEQEFRGVPDNRKQFKYVSKKFLEKSSGEEIQ